jgi:hypothetical protein
VIANCNLNCVCSFYKCYDIDIFLHLRFILTSSTFSMFFTM